MNVMDLATFYVCLISYFVPVRLDPVVLSATDVASPEKIKLNDIRDITEKDLMEQRRNAPQLDLHSSTEVTLLRGRIPNNPCRFRRCYLGQRCVVDGLTGRGVCVCKRHCKAVEKPLCGTDGEYYLNRCEMHKQSCFSGKDIDDARHKDCFYKRTLCESDSLERFKEFLLQYHQTTTAVARSDDIETNYVSLSNSEANDSQNDSYDANPDGLSISSSSIELQKADLYSDLITSDKNGEKIKSLFQFLDLDGDGFVGSEEAYEISILEELDHVMPPPCSLFHFIHFADTDHDNAMSPREIMTSYNVTLLHLSNEKKTVRQMAVQGKLATLHCEIEGVNSPVWRRQGINFEFYSASMTVDGGTARVVGFDPSLAGNYTCHAPDHLDLYQTIELGVGVAPRVQVYPNTLHLRPGSSATISCRADGVPPPYLTWFLDGKALENERYIFLDNNTELHINSVVTSDSGAYVCRATNSAGFSEEIVVLTVEENTDNNHVKEKGTYFVFHDKGIVIMESRFCRELRRLESTESVPGLLRQNKLCRASPKDGVRRCKWSQAVAVKPRFVYATQPAENRILVFDMGLMRVVEIITTDPIPTSLYYAQSTDQLFVVCQNDLETSRSTILVIHAAAQPGPHVAAQIQSLDGGNRVDFSIDSFFIPKENFLNRKSHFAFVTHNGESILRKLNLSSLAYDDHVIDFHPYNCTPIDYHYREIGGLLHITCGDKKESMAKDHLIVELSSWRVLPNSGLNYAREFVSPSGRHLVRTEVKGKSIDVYSVKASGNIDLIMSLNDDFQASKVVFIEKFFDAEAVIIYMTSLNRSDVMRLDPYEGRAQLLHGIFSETSQPSSTARSRRLIPSTWFDDRIAASNGERLNIIDSFSNGIICHGSDLSGITTVLSVDDVM